MRSSHIIRTAGAALGALALGGPAVGSEVSICTDMGAVTIQLQDEQAPLHVANFLEYVDQGFYSNTVFHRVIDGFMIQGGGYDRQLQQKQTRAAIPNESRNGLSNVRGSLAAARTSDPHSASAQYFINLVDNARLDGSAEDFGYTVFGRVLEGMDIVDTVGSLPTRGSGPFPSDVPNPLVAVRSMARLDRKFMEALPETGPENALRNTLQTAVAAQDPGAILEHIGHFRASCLPMDSELLLIEAQAAAALLRALRAKAALDEYFGLATDTDPGYRQALALYEDIAPGMSPKIATPIGTCALPVEPAVPDGSSAALEEMVEGQTDVRQFMSDSEMYLDCLSDLIDGDQLNDSQHANAVREHNRMVSVMEQLAEEFNSQVRAYRAREE
jgi:cyclophilin family peptidyl-prolyl cis-trans isomerase